MDKTKVIQQLKARYPNKKIICIPEKEPTEILCELEPSIDHPEYSLAISVIDQSAEHHHLKATEHYKLIKGELTLFVDDVEYHLQEGDKFVLKPGQKHSTVGQEAWVECYSEPGWLIEDHLFK